MRSRFSRPTKKFAKISMSNVAQVVLKSSESTISASLHACVKPFGLLMLPLALRIFRTRLCPLVQLFITYSEAYNISHQFLRGYCWHSIKRGDVGLREVAFHCKFLKSPLHGVLRAEEGKLGRGSALCTVKVLHCTVCCYECQAQRHA